MMKFTQLRALIICFLFKPILAAEDFIPVEIENTSWTHKTRLSMQVFYQEKEGDSQDYSFVLESVTPTLAKTEKYIQLPKKKVKSICLTLTNYHEIPSSQDLEETVLASLIFKPTISDLLGAVFTINENTISTKPRYILIPILKNGLASSGTFKQEKVKK